MRHHFYFGFRIFRLPPAPNINPLRLTTSPDLQYINIINPTTITATRAENREKIGFSARFSTHEIDSRFGILKEEHSRMRCIAHLHLVHQRRYILGGEASSATIFSFFPILCIARRQKKPSSHDRNDKSAILEALGGKENTRGIAAITLQLVISMLRARSNTEISESSILIRILLTRGSG